MIDKGFPIALETIYFFFTWHLSYDIISMSGDSANDLENVFLLLPN